MSLTRHVPFLPTLCSALTGFLFKAHASHATTLTGDRTLPYFIMITTPPPITAHLLLLPPTHARLLLSTSSLMYPPTSSSRHQVSAHLSTCFTYDRTPLYRLTPPHYAHADMRLPLYHAHALSPTSIILYELLFKLYEVLHSCARTSVLVSP